MGGSRASLHLFEPRYRWMCRKMLTGAEAGEPLLFGWVTSHGRGSLCQVERMQETHSGYDVQFISVATFNIGEAWEEAVPHQRRAPKLLHGYVYFHEQPLQLVEEQDATDSWNE